MVTVSASVASYIGFPSHRATNSAQILQPGSSGLAGADALDDAEREPLGFLDLQAQFGQVGNWPAAEVLARERDSDPLVQPLHPPQRRGRGGHVIDQQEAAAWAQDAGHLGDRGRSSGMAHRPSAHSTVSNDSSGKSSAWASPWRRSASRPRAAARSRAMPGMAGDQSTPVSRAPSG